MTLSFLLRSLKMIDDPHVSYHNPSWDDYARKMHLAEIRHKEGCPTEEGGECDCISFDFQEEPMGDAGFSKGLREKKGNKVTPKYVNWFLEFENKYAPKFDPEEMQGMLIGTHYTLKGNKTIVFIQFYGPRKATQLSKEYGEYANHIEPSPKTMNPFARLKKNYSTLVENHRDGWFLDEGVKINKKLDCGFVRI